MACTLNHVYRYRYLASITSKLLYICVQVQLQVLVLVHVQVQVRVQAQVKAQVQAQKAIIDSETDRMKLIMEDDFKRDEAEADIRLKAAELSAKYGAEINIAEINALMERDRETIRQLAKSQAAGLFNGTGSG